MKRVILIGRTGAGKTTLCQNLFQKELRYKKTQAVERFEKYLIDTPGEYIENRSLYRALNVSAADAEIVLLVQDCLNLQTVFPPSFSMMFQGKPVYGIVTKTDLAQTDSIRRAENNLLAAGCKAVFCISNLCTADSKPLRRLLEMEDGEDNETVSDTDENMDGYSGEGCSAEAADAAGISDL